MLLRGVLLLFDPLGFTPERDFFVRAAPGDPPARHFFALHTKQHIMARV